MSGGWKRSQRATGPAFDSTRVACERLQVAWETLFGEGNPRTVCSSAPPRAFLVGLVQALTAPCLEYPDEGDRSKHRADTNRGSVCTFLKSRRRSQNALRGSKLSLRVHKISSHGLGSAPQLGV